MYPIMAIALYLNITMVVVPRTWTIFIFGKHQRGLFDLRIQVIAVVTGVFPLLVLPWRQTAQRDTSVI